MTELFRKIRVFLHKCRLSRRADCRLDGSLHVRAATDCRKLIAIGLFRDRPACPASSTFQIIKRGGVRAYAAGRDDPQIVREQPVPKQEHCLRATVLDRRPDHAVRHWIVPPALGPKRAAKIINLFAWGKDLHGVDPPCFQLWCEQRNKPQWACGSHNTDYPIIQLLARDSLKLVWDPPEYRLIRRPVQRCRSIGCRHTISAFIMKMGKPRRSTHAGIKRVSIEPFIMNAVEI